MNARGIMDSEVRSLVDAFLRHQITRREFLNRGALLLGSLAAANSLLAACSFPAAEQPTPATSGQSDPTPASGTATGTGGGQIVDYEGPGEGYLSLPSGSAPVPAVVVIQEWWGLDDHIKSVADRFTEEGFMALAPDLYHGRVAAEPDEARKLAMELEQDVATEEIQNAIHYLITRDDVKPAQVAVIGFCMGGGLALQMAVKGEHVAIVAPFYGRPLDQSLASQVRVPVVGSYGEQDDGIPADAVRAMEEQIQAAGQSVDIKFYPAGHAFFNDTRPSYNAAAAEDAWKRTLEAFRQTLAT